MRELLPFTLTEDPLWLLVFDGFDAGREAQLEAVCALVNGYQGSRAALEEGHPASRPATFLAGVFNTPTAPQAAELQEPIPELVVAPDWSPRLPALCLAGRAASPRPDRRADARELQRRGGGRGPG
jgi:hypothetical protein